MQNFERVTRQVRFDVSYASGGNKGKIKAIDTKTDAIICEVETDRTNPIDEFY